MRRILLHTALCLALSLAVGGCDSSSSESPDTGTPDQGTKEAGGDTIIATQDMGGDSKTQDTGSFDSQIPRSYGEPCTLPGTLDAGVPTTMLNFQATDCESQLCVYLGLGEGTPEPLCTKTCSGDADCGGTTTGCPGGFICAPPVVTGAYACCKMCLCKDFLPGGVDPNIEPCKNVTPTCP